MKYKINIPRRSRGIFIILLPIFFQPFPCPQSQRQLGEVGQYEGEYALGEGGKKRYGPLRVAVNLYEPEGAEGIAGQQAEEQRQRLSPKPRLIAAEQAIDGA